MSIATSLPGSLPPLALPPYPVRRFSVAEYHQMFRSGILTEDDDVELLEGWIVPKMTRGGFHDQAIELADEALTRLLPAGWRIRIQSAITTSDSEPEPDLAIVQGSIRNPRDEHPGSGSTGLVVEVSDSTLATDRIDKGRLYARANIPTYWIINLVDRQLEVYAEPLSGETHSTYRLRRDYLPGDSVTVVLAGQPIGTVAVSDLLP